MRLKQDPLIFEDKIIPFIIGFVIATISLLILSSIGIRQLKKTKPKRDKKNKIMSNLKLIDIFIEESKIKEVVDKIDECKVVLKTEDNPKLHELFQVKMKALNPTITRYNMALTKKKLLALSTYYSTITIPEVLEKYNMTDDKLVINAILEMIENSEIYAEYIPSTRTIVFQLESNVEEIDKLMKMYEDWEERNIGKKI